jgi:cystathionine beta-lyase/cystathionine gamma-synthase
VAPLDQTSAFEDGYAEGLPESEWREFPYTRIQNLTVGTLEKLMCRLEGGSRSLAYSSDNHVFKTERFIYNVYFQIYE